MKCPNCNAETDKRVCPYCGSEVPNPNAGKTKCPKCGSRNVTFSRESYSSKNRSTSVRVTKRVRTRSGGSSRSYRTIGLCQDCGFTWAPNSGGSASKPWWMWVLIIMFWPISLSIWFWKTSMVKLPNKTKGIILGAVWGVFLLITVIAGASGEGTEKTTETTMPVENVAVDRQMPEAVDSTTPTPIPTEEPSQPESEPEEETKKESSDTVSTAYATDVVNIREQPNTDCEILGKTKPGDEVTVLGTEGDWSHVMTNGTDGYIKSEYLSDKPLETAAATAEPATEAAAAPAAEPTVAEPVPEAAPVQQDITVNVSGQGRSVTLPAGTMVWLSKSGSKFHNKNNCGSMDSSKAFQVTVEEAVKKHKEACENCY